MATDYSRVRLNPLLDYAGVELKQGGVLIDADANELVDILDRRLRALASDVLGRATVSSTTVDAFKVGVSGTALTIGRGRLYVDGLLAENHGAVSNDPAKRVFDALMAESQFADPIPYTAQPYLPNPPALPTTGRHLVYLDVWNREVTYLEQPDLVESAVGVDATSRIQTVWQVRAVAEDAGTASTCASPDGDLPGWPAIIAPSTGVLTTGTFEVAAVDDPCELPPTGGYRGLENQLYRVEIHDPGQPGGSATFKWSRENASVGSRVASMVSATELELVTLGRDDVLSFKTGDWVEIIDDAVEFSQVPGQMRKVTVVEATRRIQFTPALPASMLPGTFPNSAFPVARNLRVRRWDQHGPVFRTDVSGKPVQVQDLDAAGSNGVIAVPTATTSLLLENGVTVSFDSTGAKGFKAGDYWVFVARTADASVELLHRAPPRGIHHHFARLAIWDVGAGTVTDCRHPWPPAAGEGVDCSCTACVTAASHASGQFTIQDAVNKVAQTGGTVCLGPGQYALRAPVQLNGVRGVRIRGQGAATTIVAAGSVFAVTNGAAIGIENMAILSLGRQPAITVQTAIGLVLRQLLMAVIGTADSNSSGIALQGIVAGASIADNAVFASVGILANDPTAPQEENANQTPFLVAAALEIEDNVLWCRRQAIALDGSVLHLFDTRIVGNDVVACAQQAVSATGLAAAGATIAVCRNNFSIAGDGVRCAVGGAWIDENKLVNTAVPNQSTAIALVPGLGKSGPTQCQILANQIAGFGSAGMLVGAPVRDLIIKLNIIENCGNGILCADNVRADSISIENNHLRNIDSGREGTTGMVVGIGVVRAASATIAGNTIRRLGVAAVQSQLRAGISGVGVDRARILGNEVSDLAPPGDFVGRAAGILLMAPLVDFETVHNHVERDATPSTQRSNGDWEALAVLETTGVLQAGKIAVIQVDAGRKLVLGAGRPFLSQAAIDAKAPGAKGSILGNVLVSRGDSPAVQVTAAECLFSDNRVDARLNQKIAVALAAPVAIVNANRVIGNEMSIQITGANAKSATVLGNVTTGAISLGGTGLPAPWDALNVRA
ncbi:MAG: right-handed parallel beta-helix repeat-containing protein [Proteobacteria bacterium]|nr:right-handed parallel beta-helix repeat-containing protein [Pseudomonadota bacterium]